jgi:hypothetical protein
MTVPDVVALMSDYTSFFRRAPPVDGDDATHEVIVVVFPGLTPDCAGGLFDGVLQERCRLGMYRAAPASGPMCAPGEEAQRRSPRQRTRPARQPVSIHWLASLRLIGVPYPRMMRQAVRYVRGRVQPHTRGQPGSAATGSCTSGDDGRERGPSGPIFV